MLGRIHHGSAPRPPRFLCRAQCPYSAFRSVVGATTAQANARSFTTAPMLMTQPGSGTEPPSAEAKPAPTKAKSAPKGKVGRPRLNPGEGKPIPKRLFPSRFAAAMKATTPIAERLANAGIWKSMMSRKNRHTDVEQLVQVEKLRVNIVSDKLCDDVIKRLGPSLERHKGCDLLDLNPGVGLWSRALHDAVQPRRHIMMEPRAEEYKPFIEESMGDRPNVTIIPKLGVMWKDLLEVLETHLTPHHTPVPQGQTPQRHDSILVSINVATFPNRTIFSFPNLSMMVVYQLIRAMRMSSFFQQYGLVRVLVWGNDELKNRVLPPNIGERTRSSFQAELACEYIHEVAGMDNYDFDASRRNSRDEWLSYESAAKCFRNMQELGIEMIPGRESQMFKALEADPSLLTSEKLAGLRPINILRPFQGELQKLEQPGPGQGNGDSATVLRLKKLRMRNRAEEAEYQILLELLQSLEKLMAMGRTHPDFAKLEQQFNDRLNNTKRNMHELFAAIRDNYFTFRRSGGPTLLWDRRQYEPLTIDSKELYPNADVCLLDLQPRAMDPLLREFGPGSTGSGDISDALLRTAFQSPSSTLQSLMNSMWPGFADLADQCPSFTDHRLGGSPVSGHGTFAVRAMSEENWVELVRAWMDWPFRPSLLTLIGRSPVFATFDSVEDNVPEGSSMFTRRL